MPRIAVVGEITNPMLVGQVYSPDDLGADDKYVTLKKETRRNAEMVSSDLDEGWRQPVRVRAREINELVSDV